MPLSIHIFSESAYIHGIISSPKKRIKEGIMAETKVQIEGMSCQHCVMAVKKALGGVPAVIESDVQIGSAFVKYDESKAKETDIQAAIEKAGYKVVK
jgi:copper chaperone